MFHKHSLRRPDVQIMEYDTFKFIFILSEKERWLQYFKWGKNMVDFAA